MLWHFCWFSHFFSLRVFQLYGDACKGRMSEYYIVSSSFLGQQSPKFVVSLIIFYISVFVSCIQINLLNHLQCVSFLIQTNVIKMNMERIEVDGIEIITEDDRNKVQGSLKLRIRARISLFKRKISNKFKRRDYVIEKVHVNIHRINCALNKLNLECNNVEIISDNQMQISLIRYELAEITTWVNRVMSIQIE